MTKIGNILRRNGNHKIKNGSNGFLQTRYINTFLDAFLNIVDAYFKKIDGSPNLVEKFLLSKVHVLKKHLKRLKLQIAFRNSPSDVFSDVTVAHYRKIDRSPNLVLLF